MNLFVSILQIAELSPILYTYSEMNVTHTCMRILPDENVEPKDTCFFRYDKLFW